ncbi:(2,3-dihydroxybenzoyl)adenylate synthase [Streptomyces lancefieldiae]|uniref:(2,3-dihydroxybenzoyl)adenylate synthase n=1 Tax=Streptomyces lancefieldiae TaxID=3075520 RepID=A0ABU3AMS6_9ACTN|nr:(2,3-dihydroxybenzoyl)adenylate synthase [Streptomyces sp. DSM 40712]MDT0611479.1 (2,3-dihydroxybenzoyl)adenylate synthase [Streptomyces sp. DSM 40712]
MLDGFVHWPEELAAELRRTGVWRGRPIGDLLHESCRRNAGRVAVVCGERRMTYAELSRRADGLAGGLIQLGIKPLDRVVVHLPNVPEFVVLVFALLRAGAVPVLALPGHRRTEISHLCAHSGAVAYVVKDEFGGFDYRTIAREIPSVPHLIVSGDAQEFTQLESLDSRDVALPRVDASDPALFLLSGGTTGLPKLIPRTHNDYEYVMRACAEAMQVGEEVVYLAVNPVAHQAALACPGVFGSLLLGGKAVLTSSVRPDDVFSLIRREGVTVTTVVPSVLRLWADSERPPGELSHLLIQVGSAPLDPALARRAAQVLGCRIQRWYGISEGLLTHTRLDDPEEVAVNTDGRPMSPGDEVRIVDESGNPVPEGEAGEMQVRGPYTIRGYYRAPEENARSFTPDGFFRTGDLVRRDPDGNIVIVGRIKDVINRAGEKVSAEELERHLRTHPAVQDAAVIGVADSVLGERTYAFVVLDEADVRPSAMKEFLRGRGLAAYKIPDRLIPMPQLPRTPMGKVDKKALRAGIAASKR